MKTIILSILIATIVGIAGLAGYFKFVLPDIEPAPYIKISATEANIERGKYLATHVAACMDCHSSRDWSRFSGPLKDGTLGMGGEYFGPEMGFPGKFYSKNLTPVNLGTWTDGEIFRAITSGVNKNGETLFPVMPYLYYKNMDKQDVLDIIAYIRTLPALNNTVPESAPDFPLNFIMNTFPTKAILPSRPAPSDTVNYGGYLVNMASCMDCHTQADKGELILEKSFAGGREFKLPSGTVRSANITPDVKTGIGSWDESLFVNRFKAFSHGESMKPMSNEAVNTIMPWTMYAGMHEQDLKAIFHYLKTLKPIENEVVHFAKN